MEWFKAQGAWSQRCLARKALSLGQNYFLPQIRMTLWIASNSNGSFLLFCSLALHRPFCFSCYFLSFPFNTSFRQGFLHGFAVLLLGLSLRLDVGSAGWSLPAGRPAPAFEFVRAYPDLEASLRPVQTHGLENPSPSTWKKSGNSERVDLKEILKQNRTEDT